MVNKEDGQPLKATKPMRAYVNAVKCKAQTKSGKYKIDKNHHFQVPIIGLIGKLPTSEDILKTFGPHYDLMAAFQTYFLFNGEIYQLTTYAQAITKLDDRVLKSTNCFLVLGNEHLSSSRKECQTFNDLIKKEKKLKKILMLQNCSDTAGQFSWEGQADREKANAANNPGAVQAMRTLAEERGIRVIQVREFSNIVIAEIFNAILNICLNNK